MSASDPNGPFNFNNWLNHDGDGGTNTKDNLVQRIICFQSTTPPTKWSVEALIGSSPLWKQVIQCTSGKEWLRQ